MKRKFYGSNEFDQTEIRPGLFGAVMEGDLATTVRWEIPPGTPRTGIHHHDDHEQFGLVVAGRIEVEVGGEAREVGPGEMYYAPKGVPHGHMLVLGNENAVVVDFFSPPREEYVRAANGGPAFDPVTSA